MSRKRGALRTAFAGLAAAAAVLAAVPAQARWLQAESRHFVVLSDGDEQTLRDYTAKLEKFDAFLRRVTGTASDASPTRVTIYLLSGPGELSQVMPKRPFTLAGFYYSSPDGIYAFADRSGDPRGWYAASDVIFHEYVHHFFAQYFPGYYPRWVNEGLADYYGATKFDHGKIQVGVASPERYVPLRRNPWMPIRELITRRASITDAPDAEMFYPESWLAVHYLLRDPARKGQLSAYVEAVRHGEPDETAFERCFKTDFARFELDLQSYLNRATYSITQDPNDAPPEIEVTPLSPAADRMLLVRARIRLGAADAPERERLLAAARQGALAFPDDPLALETVAMAEMNYGDLDAADAPLGKVLADHPRDVQAHFLEGRRWMIAGVRDRADRAELWKKARAAFADALGLDPDFYPAMYYSALTRPITPGPEGDAAVALLARAHKLAPQVDEISLVAAEVLMRRKRYAEVIELLEPVAYAPHPSLWSQRAQALLEAARKQAGGAAPAARPAA